MQNDIENIDAPEAPSVSDAIEMILERAHGWLEAAIQSLPNLVVAVLVVLAFWLAAKAVRRIADRGLAKTPLPTPIRGLFVTIAGVAILLVGAFTALGIIGLDKTVTSLLAGVGILGLALGFAFQDIAANFMAGILMAFRRPVSIGDRVETNGHTGVVEDINLRSTNLRTPQGQRVVIPNKEVFENPIVNFSALGQRRIDIECGVSYADDLEKARRVAIEAVQGVAGRDESREPELFFKNFGGSSIDFVLRLWVPYDKHAEYLAKQSEAVILIKKAFDREGISIPFPITTLDFGIAGGEKLSEHLRAAANRGAD